MEEHVVLALQSRRCFNIAGTPALDLHAAACLLLDVLNISATMPHNLGSKVEAGYRLQADGDALLRPFPLSSVRRCQPKNQDTHPAKLITLNLLLLLISASEAALVNKLGQFLLHQLIN